MRKKIYISFLACLLLSNFSFSQNETDALRYSWIGTGGTARYQSLGGAMGALGGDPSCMAMNPAGLARFTKSDFTISFAQSTISTSTQYNGTTTNNGKGNFTINNIALVGATKNNEDSEWKSVQFGIGFQKLFNFNNSISISGYSPNSLLDQFAGDAHGVDPTALGDVLPYTSMLAYQTYLIDPDLTSTDDSYTTQTFNDTVFQSRYINKKGGLSEMNISISGNYLDKVYLGMSIGFPFIRYTETYTHHEEVTDTTLFLQNFDYTQDLYTRGNGINLKLGAIYTPTEWLRLGLALQTASSIGLTDEWSNSMQSQFDSNIAFDTTSPNGLFNYRLRTPGRITASAAFIISKWGLVSVDYEYVNYGKAKFKPDNFNGGGGYSFASENLVIKSIYNTASNLRAGLEGRYNWVSLRGGISIYANPFKDEDGINATTVDATRITYSGGLGFRMKGFYADLGYSITQWNEAYFMFDPLLVNTANIETNFKQFVVTAGFRF